MRIPVSGSRQVFDLLWSRCKCCEW